MHSDDDLLPISALQHLEFCPRRCALVHVEGLWSDNAQTAEGRVLHQRVHEAPSETRDGVRIVRGLRLASYQWGLFGVADVVEFYPVTDTAQAVPVGPIGNETNNSPPHAATPPQPDPLPPGERENIRPSSRCDFPPDPGVVLPNLPGRWQPYPVEYKRGRRKTEMSYLVQLCGQALCLEEMLQVPVPAGALYHGKSRRRQAVAIDDTLRRRTENLAVRLHELISTGSTPPPQPGPKCRYCSLSGLCLPGLPSSRSARQYVARVIDALLAE